MPFQLGHLSQYVIRPDGERLRLFYYLRSKPCNDALLDALERGGDLGQCIVAFEEVTGIMVLHPMYFLKHYR